MLSRSRGQARSVSFPASTAAGEQSLRAGLPAAAFQARSLSGYTLWRAPLETALAPLLNCRPPSVSLRPRCPAALLLKHHFLSAARTPKRSVQAAAAAVSTDPLTDSYLHCSGGGGIEGTGPLQLPGRLPWRFSARSQTPAPNFFHTHTPLPFFCLHSSPFCCLCSPSLRAGLGGGRRLRGIPAATSSRRTGRSPPSRALPSYNTPLLKRRTADLNFMLRQSRGVSIRREAP